MVRTKPLKKPTNTDSVVRVLGGVRGLMWLTGADQVAINNWLFRKQDKARFPAKYYDVMRMALAARGYSAPHAWWGQRGNHHRASNTRELERAIAV